MDSTYKGTITNIAFGGYGITKNNGLVVFVPFTIPDEEISFQIVKAKKNYSFAAAVSIEKPSPFRIEPRCPYFGRCGGCQFQHMLYEKQLEYKRLFVKEALQRIGKISCEVSPVVPAEEIWAYRRHITLHVTPIKKGFQAGYLTIDPISPLPVQSCDIFINSQENPLPILQEILAHCDTVDIQEGHIRILHTENAFIFAFTFQPSLPKNFAFIAEQIQNRIPTSIGVIGKSPIDSFSIGNCSSFCTIKDLQFEFSAYGFMQNHPKQSEKIYEEILYNIDPNSQKVLDLYCGIGISSLLLEKNQKKVVGIDSSIECIELAKKNSLKNHCKNVSFYAEKVEQSILSHLKKESFECIIVNPPRTGIHPKALEAILQYKPKEIFYISCKPTTLARDLSYLWNDYQMVLCKPFDMFPQTTHVETLAYLRRR